MNGNPAEIAREGLAAWREGDVQFREGGEHAVIVVAQPSDIGGSDWPEAEALAAVEHK